MVQREADTGDNASFTKQDSPTKQDIALRSLTTVQETAVYYAHHGSYYAQSLESHTRLPYMLVLILASVIYEYIYTLRQGYIL